MQHAPSLEVSRPDKPRSSSARRASEPPQSKPRTLPERLGRYTLFSHIGKGGMADIYLASAATELGASRLVVIEEVLPALAHHQGFADMLVSEAKLAARLDHANIAKVEDLGRDGALYIAMEYVEGVDLREMLRRSARAKIPVPVEFSLRVATEALRALHFAHRFKDEDGRPLAIVHRDVSPSNVLLSFEGEVKLCDFGIARANPLAEGLSNDPIQGKAGYMSPEQARGEALDARADVFAASIILWELLAGRRLYKAKEGETLLDVARRAEVPELSKRDLPFEEELHAIVARGLEGDPEKRYATAGAMLSDLEDYSVKARLVASPIRFGAWLTDHFGAEICEPRRAGERVLKALARGPVAKLEVVASEPVEVMTPSTFAVVDRAEDLEDVDASLVEPIAPVASPPLRSTEAELASTRARRHVAWAALVLAVAAAVALSIGKTMWQAFFLG